MAAERLDGDREPAEEEADVIDLDECRYILAQFVPCPECGVTVLAKVDAETLEHEPIGGCHQHD